MRLILLDQVVLQQEGILFALHHYIFDIRNVCYQLPCLERSLIFVEVTAYAPLEILGFADIYHFTGSIQVLVHTRSLGHALQ